MKTGVIHLLEGSKSGALCESDGQVIEVSTLEISERFPTRILDTSFCGKGFKHAGQVRGCRSYDFESLTSSRRRSNVCLEGVAVEVVDDVCRYLF